VSLLSVIPRPVRRALRPVREFLFPQKPALPPLLAELPPPALLGCLNARMTTHVAGWIRNEDDPADRVAFEVVCTLPGAERVLARGIADQADGGFRVEFAAPVSVEERDHVEVRPLATGKAIAEVDDIVIELPPPPAPVVAAPPPVIGYVRERSTRHVAGWIKRRDVQSERVAFEVVCTLPGAERVVANGVAAQFDRTMYALHFNDPVFGDAVCGFRVNFPEHVSELERDHIEVRPLSTGRALPADPKMQTEWKPIRFIAMDIVDNCNLRCPFCLFDHEPVHKTNWMSFETFSNALRLLPYIGPEGHWMSCLHEPSMHPQLTELIQRIPLEYRKLMHYTTNLAKRMPEGYFEALADSGLSNLNVSIESRDPAIYERMRKGARHRIFMENWEKLLDAFSRGKAPPPLRYIAMAYKSNYREIPSLIEYLRNERRAWKIEIRDTMDTTWIPKEFKAAEYLDNSEWVWLHAQLKKYHPEEVALVLPANFRPEGTVDAEMEAAAAPVAAAPVEVVENPMQAAMDAGIPGMIEARILHDGAMFVYSCPAGNYPVRPKQLAMLNINDVDDVDEFVMSFVRQTSV
jgi:molybdenum cofactor biosynthesis enzyme MoaA